MINEVTSHLVLDQCVTDDYALYWGDSVEVMRAIPDSSIGCCIHSPPYIDLYVYTDTERDVGNCGSEAQFWEHYGLIIGQLSRVMMPGRLVCVDCMNIPLMKERVGYIGLRDFRGDIIRAYEECGFIFHSEFLTWRNPLVEATRSKALGLLHKQLLKDSAMSRAGMGQYLLCFRRPGGNPEAIAHPDGLDHFIGLDPPDEDKCKNVSHERWRRYASPVWMDINVADTLNARKAKDKDDEKHVCPMPLPILKRALWLYSNPNDIVLDPFGGIGSTPYQARRMRPPRRTIAIELKESYFRQMVNNVSTATVQLGLFGE